MRVVGRRPAAAGTRESSITVALDEPQAEPLEFAGREPLEGQSVARAGHKRLARHRFRGDNNSVAG